MKKFILVLALLGLTFSSFGVVASAAAFTDLEKGQRFYDEMLFLENKGIITGFPDGTFRPERVVTRADAAIMIGRALDLDGEQRATKFRDVSADQKASGYIASAVEAGIIQGFLDETYRPDETVTRGQMAIFLSRAFQLTEEADVPFRDVSSSMKSYVHIKRIVAENITSGYEDRTYRPEIKVTRAQFSAFLARALDDQFKVDLPPAPSSNKEIYLGKLAEIESKVKVNTNGVTFDLISDSAYNLDMWDAALNEIYGVLNEVLPPSEMNQLRDEQRQWIVDRDKAARERYDQEGGGSLSRVVHIISREEWTRERCYELVNKHMK